MDNLITVDASGNTGTKTFSTILYDNEFDFHYQLMQLLRKEAHDPNSEFMIILKEAMNTIADDEIEKVLK